MFERVLAKSEGRKLMDKEIYRFEKLDVWKKGIELSDKKN